MDDKKQTTRVGNAAYSAASFILRLLPTGLTKPKHLSETEANERYESDEDENPETHHHAATPQPVIQPIDNFADAPEPEKREVASQPEARPTQPRRRRWPRQTYAEVLSTLSFLTTVALVIFTYYQWQESSGQRQAARDQADISKEQAEIMREQLESMNSSSGQTNDLIAATQKTADASHLVAEQNKELVKHAGEQADASAIQANASQMQARTSGQIAMQNERLVRSAEAQASAMREQSSIALKQFEVTDRPWLAVDVAPFGPLVFSSGGGGLEVMFTLKNVGRSVATRATINSEVFIPKEGKDMHRGAIERQKELCKNVNSQMMAYTIFPDATYTLRHTYNIGSQVFESGRVKPTKNVFAFIVGCVDYQFGGQPTPHQTGFIYQIFNTDPDKQGSIPLAIVIGVDVSPDMLRFEKNIISGDYAY